MLLVENEVAVFLEDELVFAVAGPSVLARVDSVVYFDSVTHFDKVVELVACVIGFVFGGDVIGFGSGFGDGKVVFWVWSLRIYIQFCSFGSQRGVN